MANIPKEITELAAEALSDHNNGWTKEGCQKRLEEIRDFIDRILAKVKRDDEIKRHAGGRSSC